MKRLNNLFLAGVFLAGSILFNNCAVPTSCGRHGKRSDLMENSGKLYEISIANFNGLYKENVDRISEKTYSLDRIC